MVTSYLVRHAEAGRRQAWDGPDELRPLTDEGWGQARRLAAMLGAAELSRILSSPFARCVQTVEPLAAARGMTVEASPGLAEGSGPAAAVGCLGVQPTLVCSHGDVVEEALEVLAWSGVTLAGRVPGEDTPKGATWVLECSGGRVVAGRLLPPP